MQTRPELIDRCRAMIVAGNGTEEELVAKIDSIVVLREVLSIDLGEAKRLVHCSPTWADTLQRSMRK